MEMGLIIPMIQVLFAATLSWRFYVLTLDFVILQRQNWDVNSLSKEKSNFFMKKSLDFLVQSKILP
jgi:hypothetical protein